MVICSKVYVALADPVHYVVDIYNNSLLQHTRDRQL